MKRFCALLTAVLLLFCAGCKKSADTELSADADLPQGSSVVVTQDGRKMLTGIFESEYISLPEGMRLSTAVRPAYDPDTGLLQVLATSRIYETVSDGEQEFEFPVDHFSVVTLYPDGSSSEVPIPLHWSGFVACGAFDEDGLCFVQCDQSSQKMRVTLNRLSPDGSISDLDTDIDALFSRGFPDRMFLFPNGDTLYIQQNQAVLLGADGVRKAEDSAENVILGMKQEERYNIREVTAKVAEITERYGFRLDPTKKIYDLSVSEKQTVEIIKVLYRGADILILDEPTAVLTPQEITKLFDVLWRMKEDGKSVIIITHKLNEVLEVSDRVTILRRGKHIATVNTAETDEAQLTEMMVGRAVSLNIDRPEPYDPQLLLEVKDVTIRDAEGLLRLNRVSFDVYSGEILGIAGISGSGQKELLEAIYGLQKLEAGSVLFHPGKGSGKGGEYLCLIRKVFADDKRKRINYNLFVVCY